MKVVHWERMQFDVTVKELGEDGCRDILNRKCTNVRDYKVYVISKTVYGFVKLLKHIKLYSSHYNVKQDELIDELFNLVVEVNPILAKYNSIGEAVCALEENTKEQDKVFEDIKRSEILTLGDRVKNIVLGQDKAINKIILAVQRASAGLRDPEQPIGCFLLTGPTGVGKTYLGKILAQELVGSQSNLIRVDCSEFQQRHEVAKLIGAPHGYIGFEKGGILTNAISKTPFSIVLFDEIEKAHDTVFNLLLQIMDEGILTANVGSKHSFSQSIILMTSNLGVDEAEKVTKTLGFGDVSVLTDEKRIVALETALKKKFRPEFLNRLDEVSHFMPLSDKEICKKIVVLELGKLLEYLKANKGMAVAFDDATVDNIYDKGFDVEYGARPLRRAIRKYFANPLSHRILVSNLQSGTDLRSTVINGEIVFEEIKGVEEC